MAYVAGIDEAGYGPLMGPLVVSATAFHVPDDAVDADLWDRFAPDVVRDGRARGSAVRVTDSKRLHRSNGNLRALEDNILPFLGLLGPMPRGAGKLLERFAGCDDDSLRHYPWYCGADQSIPRHADRKTLRAKQENLSRALRRAGCLLCFAQAQVVDVRTFNREVAALGNKSKIVGWRVASYLAALWEVLGHEEIRVVVDRQGGRKSYGPFLAATLPFASARVVSESAERSEYVLAGEGRRMRVCFAVRADQRALPVALASMLSKYVRELLMERLNAFWSARVEALRPTAGYVQDGRRFLAEIESARAAEGIPRDLLVRCR